MSHATDAPPDPWPPRHLVLRTPRLELRPDDDAGLDELVAVGYRGVHPPEQMPFHVPWTDADPRYLGRGMLQHFWQQRSVLAPENWALHFLVRVEGRVVGVQTIRADDFARRRTVASGSWIGREVQGRGIGTEMRTAVLTFAFDHLGATRATSAAFADNRASLRVSDKLGYRRTGTTTVVRRGEPAEEVQVAVTPDEFVRPDWTVTVDGYPACAGLLGAAPPA